MSTDSSINTYRAFISPWMIESTELAPLRVGQPIELAFALARPRTTAARKDDQIELVRVVRVVEAHYLVVNPVGELGPYIIPRNVNLPPLLVGASMAGHWLLMPDVDASHPPWAPGDLKPILDLIRKVRVPTRIWEIEPDTTDSYLPVTSTRDAATIRDRAYRVEFTDQ